MGELYGIWYDKVYTPNVAFGYDRRGRQTSVTERGGTTTLRQYDDAGNLLREDYQSDPLSRPSVLYAYDQYLRRTNMALFDPGKPATIAVWSYAYDSASRLQTVSDGVNSASYSYVANSPLVGQIAFTNNGTGRMTTTKTFDYLNRLTSISSSSPSSSSLSSFAYVYNSANQRTAVTNADNARWVYQYDALGQVISGKKYWSDGTPVAGQQFEYTFDDIGNRKTTRAGGSEYGTGLRSASYAANSLNQYTSRTVPGAVDIIGSANSNATVTVNNQPTYRKGEYFRTELALDNSPSAVYASVTNLAVLNNGTNADIIATNLGTVFLPQTPESFGYDADGNLTNDGRWTYTWDAENRLLSDGIALHPARRRPAEAGV